MSRAHTPISRGLVALLALICGATAANLYYAQPLLPTIAREFGVSLEAAGLPVTASQIGYLAGLIFLVPLGDRLERRRLITGLLLVTAAGLLTTAVTPNFMLFAACLALVGTTSAVAQIIVPMAASLAGSRESGRVVGTVMAGLLIGILASRILSGLIASYVGWRAVFVVAAAAMLVLAGLLRWRMPAVPANFAHPLSYGALLRSVAGLVHDEPVLRRRMLLGAMGMGCFSAMWTAIAFLLAGAPYHYGDAAIGLFGFAGLIGAFAARSAGTLADKGYAGAVTIGAILILIASWGLLLLGGDHLAALVIGVVALDLGVQALHLSNQTVIYALRPEARSRLTTAYMVAYFLGGIGFSAAASLGFAIYGWVGVCILGVGAALTALIVWLAAMAKRSPSRRSYGRNAS